MNKSMVVEQLPCDQLKKFFNAALAVVTRDIPKPEIHSLKKVVDGIFDILFQKRVSTGLLNMLVTEDWEKIGVEEVGLRGYHRERGMVHVRAPLDELQSLARVLARNHVESISLEMVIAWTMEEIRYARDGLLSPTQYSMMNRLFLGTEEEPCPGTDSIVRVLGIERVQCGIRLYRLITYLEEKRRNMPAIVSDMLFRAGERDDKPLINPITKDRIQDEVEISGATTKESAEEMAEALYRNTIVERVRTELLHKDRLIARRLVRHTPPKSVGNTPDYTLQVLLFFLIQHIKAERKGKREKGFRLFDVLTDFLLEQEISVSSDARDLRRMYNRIEKVALQEIYESYREFYVAFLMHKQPPSLDDQILASQALRTLAVDPTSTSTNPCFLELFPSWEDIMPIHDNPLPDPRSIPE